MSRERDYPEEDFLFLPLGGSDEIGMNLNLYHYAGKWLMVDLGISFGDDATPGLDVIMPDPTFIEERRDDLVGLLLTHGHEDHIGAIPYLWERLGCPIYATPFTASMVRRKLAEANLLTVVELIEIDLGANFVVGPFEIEYVGLTHSIPEPNAIAIRCGAGTVLHTGDWKFDPEPLVGEVADKDALQEIAEEGVLALVADSTNVFVPGRTGSEREIAESLKELFATLENRIAVTCFASNVARIDSIARAAMAVDRHAVLVGRAMHRIVEVARENGYLTDLPRFVSEEEAGYLPRDKVVLICTGTQGEGRAAMARIADESHPEISLQAGDTVVFSAREIPGNERAIARVQGKLTDRGIEVVTEADHHVHVSGHPAREEMVEMYQLVRPELAVPVHGDARHLREHAKLARTCQVPNVVVPGNGTVVRLGPGTPMVIDRVRTASLTMDGGKVRAVDAGSIKDRRRMLFNGASTVTVVLDAKGNIRARPQVSLIGLTDAAEAEEVVEEVVELVDHAVRDLPTKRRRDDGSVAEAARQAVRRMTRVRMSKRPLTTVHVVRLD